MNTGESTTRSFSGLAQPPAGAVAPTTDEQSLREATIELSVSQDTQTVAAPPQRRLTRIQWIVAGTLVALAALTAARLLAIDGLLRRVTIDGPSMAPAFCGAHYRVTCDDCRFPFRCDAVAVPSSGEVVCPNCGYRKNKLLAANLQAGEQVLIDRWPLAARGPRRGEVVAAQQPGSPGAFVVKRVAALPGERLAIRGGDLYAEGEIVRKTLQQFHDVRVLVHDNDFQPAKTAGLPPRWQPASGGPQWKSDGTGFRRELTREVIKGGPPDALFWLHYHHWHAMESAAPRTRDALILDNDSYNQNLSRQLNPVTDIALACQIRAAGSGRFALAVADGAQRFEALFEPDQQRVVVQLDGKPIAERDFVADFARAPVAVEFGLCDQQVFLSVAGRELLREPYERSRDPQFADLQSLEIGARRLDIEISRLQVWRDLYYLEPLGTSRPWQADQPLAAGELALLGDNPPVSTDARHWPASGGVPRSSILGRIARPFWAAAP